MNRSLDFCDAVDETRGEHAYAPAMLRAEKTFAHASALVISFACASAAAQPAPPTAAPPGPGPAAPAPPPPPTPVTYSAPPPAPVAPTPPADASPPGEPGAHAHDGFYLRVSTGFSGYSEIIGHKGSDERLTITGVGTTGELAIGGTIGRNVFGGGVWGTSVLASTVTISNPQTAGTAATPAPADRPTVTLIGPFIDHYFEGNMGTHFQAAIGFAGVRGPEFGGYSTDTKALAPGAGLMLAFGKDWWVGDQWSVGVMGRLIAAAAVEKQDGVSFYHLVGASPAAVFTIVYH